MESITLKAPDTEEEITVFVLEETTLNEHKYLLVAEDSEGDTEASHKGQNGTYQRIYFKIGKEIQCLSCY